MTKGLGREGAGAAARAPAGTVLAASDGWLLLLLLLLLLPPPSCGGAARMTQAEAVVAVKPTGRSVAAAVAVRGFGGFLCVARPYKRS